MTVFWQPSIIHFCLFNTLKLFFEECKVIRIFRLSISISASSFCNFLLKAFSKHLFWIFDWVRSDLREKLALLSIFILWCHWIWVITHALVWLISWENTIIYSIASVRFGGALVVMPGVAAPVLVAVGENVVVADCSRGWGQTSVTGRVASALVEVEWAWKLVQVFALADLGRVLQAVCLLDEEHVPVVLRCLHYFRHCLARVYVSFRRLGLRRLWNLVLLLRLWRSVCCSEATKSGLIQLLLSLEAGVGISDADVGWQLLILFVLVERAAWVIVPVVLVGDVVNHAIKVWTFWFVKVNRSVLSLGVWKQLTY